MTRRFRPTTVARSVRQCTRYFSILAFLAGSLSSIPSNCLAATTRNHCELANGAIQLDADNIVGGKDESNSCTASGSAVASIPRQDAKLQGDRIDYNKETHTLEATGNAHLLKNGFEKKGDRLTLVVEPLPTFADMASIASPAPGPLFGDRLSFFNCLMSATKAEVDLSSYIPAYKDIEKTVLNNGADKDTQTKLTAVRQEIGHQLGAKEQLVDQYYGNGPLSKLCRQAEASLRANGKKVDGFDDLVYVLCTVGKDGVFSRLEADDPTKYGPTVSGLACERVKALNLKSPSKDPLPLVIALSNKPDLNIVYVSGINFDTYLAYLDSHIKKQWHPKGNPPAKPVLVRLDILRDGTIKGARVAESCGLAILDQTALEAVTKAQPLSPFPDGSHSELNTEFAFAYEVHGK
jgi:TonB family protein